MAKTHSSKFIMDAIWGEIEVTPFALKFLDVFEFQRMRFMKQLGPCNFVYSCAETSRFAHSLGVYYLTRRMVRSLHNKDSSLLITPRLIDLISIAALYHDVGHGPFSHTFDKITGTRHEERSKQILRHVAKKYRIDVSDSEIEFMCQVIDPDDEHKDTTWHFQIVANGDVDTDRCDYIVRDSRATGVTVTLNTHSVLKLLDRAIVDKDTQRLVYPPSVSYVVDDLLESRKYMYERVYLHPTSLKVQRLIEFALHDYLNDSTDNIERFMELSDSILQEVFFSSNDNAIVHAINRIFIRDLND